MLDISLHILDLCQNSINAKATFIEIDIKSTPVLYEIKITDNGIGMSGQMIKAVRSPFVTTSNKSVGLGIPLFIDSCEQTGGVCTIESIEGSYTTITGTIYKNHYDAIDLGDIAETIYLLFILNQTEIVFKYNNFEINTNELNNLSKKHSISNPVNSSWIKDYIKKNIED